jgi:hypothetical protein
MAIELVNIGNAANDGTGDDLREAFIKVNSNFEELDSRANQIGANLGSAGAEVYKTADANTLYFRRLVAGDNIRLTTLENTIVIDNTMPESRFNISTNSGSVIGGDGISLNLLGADAVTISANENTKTITVTSSLENDPSPSLGEDLNAENFDINNVGTITASNVNAGVVDAANLIPVQLNGIPYSPRLGRYIEGFDFGDIADESYSILDWIIKQVGVDFGTFNTPASGTIDIGTF